MLLALVQHRPSTIDYAKRPLARLLTSVVLKAFCGVGILIMFAIIGVALWSSLSGLLHRA